MLRLQALPSVALFPHVAMPQLAKAVRVPQQRQVAGASGMAAEMHHKCMANVDAMHHGASAREPPLALRAHWSEKAQTIGTGVAHTTRALALVLRVKCTPPHCPGDAYSAGSGNVQSTAGNSCRVH